MRISLASVHSQTTPPRLELDDPGSNESPGTSVGITTDSNGRFSSRSRSSRPGCASAEKSRVRYGLLQSPSTSTTLQSFSRAMLEHRFTQVKLLPSPESAEATISKLPSGTVGSRLASALLRSGRLMMRYCSSRRALRHREAQAVFLKCSRRHINGSTAVFVFLQLARLAHRREASLRGTPLRLPAVVHPLESWIASSMRPVDHPTICQPAPTVSTAHHADERCRARKGVRRSVPCWCGCRIVRACPRSSRRRHGWPVSTHSMRLRAIAGGSAPAHGRDRLPRQTAEKTRTRDWSTAAQPGRKTPGRIQLSELDVIGLKRITRQQHALKPVREIVVRALQVLVVAIERLELRLDLGHLFDRIVATPLDDLRGRQRPHAA